MSIRRLPHELANKLEGLGCSIEIYHSAQGWHIGVPADKICSWGVYDYRHAIGLLDGLYRGYLMGRQYSKDELVDLKSVINDICTPSKEATQ